MRIPVLAAALAALACASSAARAQDLADYDYENLTFRGVGFGYGYIWPSNVETTPTYSIRLDLGFLGPAVRISPGMSYWSSRLRTRELDVLAERISQLPAMRDNGVELTAQDMGTVFWSDLVLSLDAHVVFTAPYNIITFVGAGVGLHALNGRGDAIDDTFVEDLLDSTSAGMTLLAGAEVQPVSRLRIYGEARYTVVSDVRYPGVRIGLSLMLPPRNEDTVQGGR
jgi:opacity protein-like surface antigen